MQCTQLDKDAEKDRIYRLQKVTTKCMASGTQYTVIANNKVLVVTIEGRGSQEAAIFYLFWVYNGTPLGRPMPAGGLAIMHCKYKRTLAFEYAAGSQTRSAHCS